MSLCSVNLESAELRTLHMPVQHLATGSRGHGWCASLTLDRSGACGSSTVVRPKGPTCYLEWRNGASTHSSNCLPHSRCGALQPSACLSVSGCSLLSDGFSTCVPFDTCYSMPQSDCGAAVGICTFACILTHVATCLCSIVRLWWKCARMCSN